LAGVTRIGETTSLVDPPLDVEAECAREELDAPLEILNLIFDVGDTADVEHACASSGRPDAWKAIVAPRSGIRASGHVLVSGAFTTGNREPPATADSVFLMATTKHF
jgi:hypothetical protein